MINLLSRNSSYFGVSSSDSKCGKQSRSSSGRHGGLSHLRPTHLFTFGQSSPRGPFGPPDFSTNEKGPSPSSALRTHALYLRLSSPTDLRAPARHLLGKRPVGTRALLSGERGGKRGERKGLSTHGEVDERPRGPTGSRSSAAQGEAGWLPP